MLEGDPELWVEGWHHSGVELDAQLCRLLACSLSDKLINHFELQSPHLYNKNSIDTNFTALLRTLNEIVVMNCVASPQCLGGRGTWGNSLIVILLVQKS